MCEQEKQFCERLAEAFPDVRNILNEHLSDYEELLPHVFMGDVTRYVLQDGPQRAAVVQQVEDTFKTASGGVEELIAVSFVENIETAEGLTLALKGVTGNTLRTEWQRQHES